MSEGTGAAPRRPADVPPGERGATRIADRVVAKIAARAALEAIRPLPPGAARPHATVVVHHDAAHLHIHLELDYPTDIGPRCHTVRRHVTERVGALVGMQVPEVAVQVEKLHLTAAHGAPHGRTR
ncbi:Asp23/Gls24 family envelope stress response protein [Streptomyces sp. YKOK-I1]